jgi:hypothetical protein
MWNLCRAQSAWMRALALGLLVIAAMPAQPAAAQVDDSILAVYQFTPGWATFGIVLPRGEATAALQVGELPTQTDVKSRWDDGSIKSAIVTANVPVAGHYAITAASAPAGEPFRPSQWPTAIVEFTTATGTYKAQLPTAPSFQDRWLGGPLVAEARWLDTPIDTTATNTGTHPSLRVLFDVRSYGPSGSGQHWIDVTVENVLDHPSANSVTYDVSLTIGGAKPVVRAGVVHNYLTRWRMTFPVSPGLGAPLQLSTVIPDFGPFVRAGAIPNYLPTVFDGAYSTVGSQFDILKFGSLTVPMNAHSGRAELAPYPDWAAQAMVHRRPLQLDYVIKHGELAGSFATHFKERQADPNTGHDWFTIDRHPNFWLDGRADPNESGQPTSRPLNGLAGMGEPGDIAHQPSLAYLPYLITGQRYFLDELTHWANYTLIGTFQDRAQNLRGGGYVFPNGVKTPRFPGSHGLIVFNETRGIGWGLRNIADAAFILPDAHPLKTYFAAKVENNLLWLDDYAATFNSGLLGSMFPYRRPEGRTADNYAPWAWISMWEQSYVGWAVDRARRILEMPEGLGFLERLAAFDLKLFTSEPDFPREWAGIYLLAVGRHSTTPLDFNTDVITYFQTMKEIFETSSTAKDDPDGDGPQEPASGGVGDFYRQFEGFYGPEHRLLVMVARGLGMPGAEEAYAYLMAHVDDSRPDGAGAPGGISMVKDLNARSGWAIGLGGVAPLSTDAAPGKPTLRTNTVTATSPIQ